MADKLNQTTISSSTSVALSDVKLLHMFSYLPSICSKVATFYELKELGLFNKC